MNRKGQGVSDIKSTIDEPEHIATPMWCGIIHAAQAGHSGGSLLGS